jgi:hypothetical protein
MADMMSAPVAVPQIVQIAPRNPKPIDFMSVIRTPGPGVATVMTEVITKRE